MDDDSIEPDLHSAEDDFFHEVNRQRIVEYRIRLDEHRENHERAHQKAVHWMKCPKCGADLKEISFAGVKVDKCSDCEGMYFDRGELELVTGAIHPHSFWEQFKDFFGL